MSSTDQSKSEQPKPRKRKYITKEERRRLWGVRPLPPLHNQPAEKKSEEQ